ncbi:TraC family protein [Aeromonas enteropelogenes]|uniref:TraC family protein n=1 Tax=Aeromonas TaxID=642 RepID=UPI003B9E8B3E
MLKRALVHGVKEGDIINLSARDSFSEYLPWFKYQETHKDEITQQEVEWKAFLNVDSTIGWMWECIPFSFVGSDHLEKLHSSLKRGFPTGTVMQWILFPDHNMEGFIDDYASVRNTHNAISLETIEQTAAFIRDGAKNGIRKMGGIPIRNFRLFITLKSESTISDASLSNLEQVLTSAGLAPRRLSANDLMGWAAEFFNGHKPVGKYDPNYEIRKQIIKAETEIDFRHVPAKIGGRYASCLTPKTVPQGNNSPLRTNELFGGFMGADNDAEQMSTPFLYCLTIVYTDDIKDSTNTKAEWTAKQGFVASVAHSLRVRMEEFNSIQSSMAQDGTMAYYVPSLWVFGNTPQELQTGISRAKGLWESKDFDMQQESTIASTMFIASLPFGFYNVGQNLHLMQRHFIAELKDIARFLPVQGDFRGGSKPVLFYIGRKGQAISLDLFDKRANAHNFYVVAETGGGKSFTLNDMLGSYADTGAAVRVLDLGRSYEKLTHMHRGRFMDFSLSDRVCVNPLDFVSLDDEDFQRGLSTAQTIFGKMAYAKTGGNVNEIEAQLLSLAAQKVIEAGNQTQGTDGIIDWLKAYKNSVLPDVENTAHRLAFQLYNFSSLGAYGSFFCGKNGFHISDDPFVCVDLEKLRSTPDLFFVLVMQLTNAITQDLYLGDRSVRKFILIEELASMVKKVGNADMTGFADVCDEGYRRARKYRGSFGVVLQSPLDLDVLPGLGSVIKANAQWKFFLESKIYGEAISKGVLPEDYKGFPLKLLSSVRNVRPRYGEVFIDCPLGRGVARLCVDPWRYWVNTSDGDEVSAYNNLVAQGLEPVDALRRLSGVGLRS